MVLGGSAMGGVVGAVASVVGLPTYGGREGDAREMGLMDKFDEMKEKAKDQLGKHSDKTDDSVEKVGDKADEKTGGKYSDKVDKGRDMAKERLRNQGQQGGGQPRPGQQQNPGQNR